MALGSRNDATNNRSSSEGSEEGERTDTSDDYSDQDSYEPGNHNAQPTSTQSPNEESETTVSLNEEAEQEGIDKEMHLMNLNKFLQKGDWTHVKYLLELYPDALTKKISLYGDTTLHIAAISGHVKIVEELVTMTSAKDLLLKNNFGETALSLAACGGIVKVAKPLVRKNIALLRVRNINNHIPVVVAAQFGHIEMVRYLYYMTLEEELDPKRSKQGAKLLTTCIVAQIYDVALDLVRKFPDLSITILEEPPGGTLNTLATRHSAFPSGTQLSFWQRCIYLCMPIRSHGAPNNCSDIEADTGRSTNQENSIIRELRHLYEVAWDVLKFAVPCTKTIHEIKLKHAQVLELLSCISCQISALSHSQIEKSELFQAIFNAVKHGIVEFVEEMLKAYPDIIWVLDGDSRNIFLYAVLQRREKIFNLLHKTGPKKNMIATSLDKDGNSILHHAAMLSPSSHLDGISGAALKMQRELQWFQEVEKVVQPMYREKQNNAGKTSRSLFTSQHKRMRKEGEKWMKETSTSCTVVAALVATVMFTAIFSVPGGFDEKTGKPLYLYKDSLMIFIVSDSLSMFSSASSVLMFLGILKSRYTEDEFLVSLPRKLIIGIATLFFSIASMMVTFGTTIYIFLSHRISWISIPVLLLCCVLVMILVFPQVPLLYGIFRSTHGPGIFEGQKRRKKKKRMR
ncbi:protein ACCELERATED CELL DEATH 6-like [Diospyros lotus]|uniref:protein ACCELERATED CELL DEATH 6-like n=1 Tax=Diospyros lotus TaxID=55363 RepID=UPI0022536DF6|nr:protein ACCELERATED CELL DEATH 6-like [Diospyros lotus]